LVVERLDLRSPELSRRMNRLLSNFGRRYLKEKLARLGELYGIKVVEVNPAYSSQACSRCGYVDPRNRRDTQTFVCQACGHRGNAQVNAARN
ncbi:transposase, partial [Thermus scotoductus]